MSTYGFIYFAVNEAMPGLVKVGQTQKHPRLRLEELSRATACPLPFTILAFFDVSDARFAEKEIHDFLSEFRNSEYREFFRAPMSVLREAARMWMDNVEGCTSVSLLDHLADQEEKQEILEWMDAYEKRREVLRG